MTSSQKIVSVIHVLLGIVIAGICIWIMTSPVKLAILIYNWDGGDSAKLGIAVAVFMVVIGISALLINVEKYFIPFLVVYFIISVTAIAFMAIAIKDHGDWSKLHQVAEATKSGSFYRAFGQSSGFESKPSFDSTGSLRYKSGSVDENEINKNIKSAIEEGFSGITSVLTRLKILAAFGAIAAITMIVSLILLYMAYRKSHTLN